MHAATGAPRPQRKRNGVGPDGRRMLQNGMRYVLGLAAAGLYAAFWCTILPACSAARSSSVRANRNAPTPATDEVCAIAADCPSVECDCAGRSVEARRCIDGYCLNRASICADTCGGRNDGGADAAGAEVIEADACIAVSASLVVARVTAIREHLRLLEMVPKTPANAALTVRRTADGALSSVAVVGAGVDADYTNTFRYDSRGRLVTWSHDEAGTRRDVSEAYAYDSAGRFASVRVDAEGTTKDSLETLAYNERGKLVGWRLDGEGTESDVYEAFVYDGRGSLINWLREASAFERDVREVFTYDGRGRLVTWRREAPGTAADADVRVTYSETGNSVVAQGATATGATVKLCTDVSSN
jgi:hypothetical protein